MKEDVVLVDERDTELGVEEKLKAHQNGGRLHRAISVFVFNKMGETMLQKRAMEKYHSKGLWSNTCCSHPMPKESILSAAHRRLKEEMGFDCDMKEVFTFKYNAQVGDGLTEQEYDHILFGTYDDAPTLNPREAVDYKWTDLKVLKKEMKKSPESYTQWLKLMIDDIIDHYDKK